MAFYAPGGNQKPGSAIQKFECATDRSESPAQKDFFYKTHAGGMKI